MANSPHDALFRYTFSQPAHAAALLAVLLPPALAAAIDWSTLKLCPGTFLDRRLRRQQGDLLFSVMLGRRRIYLYLLLEHKSRSERWVALQMLGYVVSIWKSLWRQRPRPRRLPLVVPVVLHHGKGDWTAATQIVDLLDTEGVSAEVAAAAVPLQPQFRYLVKSFADCSPEDVRGMAISVLGKLTMAALQFLPLASPQQVIEGVVAWAELVRQVMSAPSGHEAIEAISHYILSTSRVDPEVLIEVVDREIDREASMKVKTAAQRLREEGKAEGKAQGRAEGQVLGAIRGRSELLLRLLQARYGDLPAEVLARVRAADLEEIDRWALRSLDAPTLSAVFAEG